MGRGCACSAGFLSWPVSRHWCAWGGKRRGTGDGGVQTLSAAVACSSVAMGVRGAAGAEL